MEPELNAVTVKKCMQEAGADPCRCHPVEAPCQIIIFGASGDLTERKLIPALFTLFANRLFHNNFSIIGCARTPIQTDEFRQKIKTSLEKNCSCDLSQMDIFLDHLNYKTVQYDDLASFQSLARFAESLDQKYATDNNFLFYLALPPLLYDAVINNIGLSGLCAPQQASGGWRRIVVEKPFGTDYQSAVELNRGLKKYFHENQIYRIDHYLAKETVQNILVFRFANTIFEPIWNRQYIDHIAICAAEKIGIERRAGYYESAGVLRDMFQNHIMQLLAMTAMEAPAQFSAEMVRDEKAKLFICLKPFDDDMLKENVVLGQYTDGSVDGSNVPGYRQETGVDPQSVIPTYALLKLFIDNWRWQGVPFYLMSGKRLAAKNTSIAVQFKDVPHSIFRDVLTSAINPNRLLFHIQPSERISLGFQAKRPGTSICLRTINMEFSYESDREKGIDAYEKVILDCINGDQMLYIRQDSEELCWGFLTPLIEGYENSALMENLLHVYPAGTRGPEAADSIFNPDHLFF